MQLDEFSTQITLLKKSNNETVTDLEKKLHSSEEQCRKLIAEGPRVLKQTESRNSIYSPGKTPSISRNSLQLEPGFTKKDFARSGNRRATMTMSRKPSFTNNSGISRYESSKQSLSEGLGSTVPIAEIGFAELGPLPLKPIEPIQETKKITSARPSILLKRREEQVIILKFYFSIENTRTNEVYIFLLGNELYGSIKTIY